MTQPIWIQKYPINTLLINSQKELGLLGLLELLQDVAWVHATHLGHGFEEMVKAGVLWALTRQRVLVNEWPIWGEEIEIRTWVRPLSGVAAHRDFEIFHGSKKIGECTTSWLTLDIQTRRPAKLQWNSERMAFRIDSSLGFDAPKIHLNQDLKTYASIGVRPSDLDMNGHVNNTRYAQWILDSLEDSFQSEFVIDGYDVNFLSECHLHDQISLLGSKADSGESFPNFRQFQGKRESDGKIVFCSQVSLSRRSFKQE